jgi:hypothetical protein
MMETNKLYRIKWQGRNGDSLVEVLGINENEIHFKFIADTKGNRSYHILPQSFICNETYEVLKKRIHIVEVEDLPLYVSWAWKSDRYLELLKGLSFSKALKRSRL